jgi:hypothetical protein
MLTLNRLIVGIAIASLELLASPSSTGEPLPAGETGATLSFIDAAAGHAEIIRHWPASTSDVDVYPFVPYFWSGCPGPGAIVMLVTGIGSGPLVDRVASALETRSSRPPIDRSGAEIARIAAALRTPGDPAQEALKAAAPWISDLSTYERWGYAVFLLIRWEGIRCVPTFKAVPEGYAIPFVR